jgi:hypothetical protein
MFDPFGRPFCVCKPSHFRLLQDDINYNNNSTTVNNEIDDNTEDNRSNDDPELPDNRFVFENVEQHPLNCYVAGSRGNYLIHKYVETMLHSVPRIVALITTHGNTGVCVNVSAYIF